MLHFAENKAFIIIKFDNYKPAFVDTMSDQDLQVTSRGRLNSRIRQVILLACAILLGVILSISCSAQRSFKKQNARHFQERYKDQIASYSNSCHILEKKKAQKPKGSHFSFRRNKQNHRPQAEVDPNPIAKATPVKPAPKPVPVIVKPETKEEIAKEEKLEDKVLKENHLPTPTSSVHEKIRKKVAEHLKNKNDNQPIDLAPLYFTFAQDEFSVVDMEPFLTAVEYALQGKIILIEGHTDNQGKDNYNVQLSIKRVQKIRELMMSMGVPDDHISVVGYGEEVSKHDNKTEQGRQMNRRVDFKAF